VDRAASDQIIEFMNHSMIGQTRIPGLLPEGTRVVHKTGSISGSTNDVGMVYLPGGGHLIVTVLTKDAKAPTAEREHVIAEIARQILVLAPDHVAGHFIRPINPPGDCLRVRVDEQLRIIKTQAALRLIGTGNPITVKLTRPRIGQENVPNLIGMFGHRNSDIFLARIEVVEEAKID